MTTMTEFIVHWARHSGEVHPTALDRETMRTELAQELRKVYGYPLHTSHRGRFPCLLPPFVSDWCEEQGVACEVRDHIALNHSWGWIRLAITDDRDAVLFKLKWL